MEDMNTLGAEGDDHYVPLNLGQVGNNNNNNTENE